MAVEEEDVKSCGSRAVESYSAIANPSSRHHHQRQKLEVYNKVLKRIQDSNFGETNLPGFDDNASFQSLTCSRDREGNACVVVYALDVNVERAEDVHMHKRLLQLAEDPARMHPLPTFGSSPNLEAFQASRYYVDDGDGAANSTPCLSQ
ncbi:hypothetical protein POTOM_017476 [Populus tomentosa]|uniref:Uncharacterized protein n=1 Tax=Populus tomentosa TaxID=118781 RepID=A0A8X8D4N1_POPTO|nr:hypothetical protein POTOM_017476 [Populus tomentosa]